MTDLGLIKKIFPNPVHCYFQEQGFWIVSSIIKDPPRTIINYPNGISFETGSNMTLEEANQLYLEVMNNKLSDKDRDEIINQNNELKLKIEDLMKKLEK